MAFTRVNPGGWASNAKLTSSQQNQLDIDHANALDKSLAGDTLSGVLTVAGPGSVAGTTASIAQASPAVLSGLSSLSSGMVGLNVTTSGCANSANNGTFPITAVNVNGGTVTYTNPSAVYPDANSGSIVWSVATPAGKIALPNAGGQVLSQVAKGIATTAAGGIVSGQQYGISLGGGGFDYPRYTASDGVTLAPRAFNRAIPPMPLGRESGWTIAESTFRGAVIGPGTSQPQEFMIPSAWDGATLSSVTAYFSVNPAHSGVPAVLPAISVYCQPLGVGLTPANPPIYLNSTPVQSFTPTPANAAAWNDAPLGLGLVQLLTFVCNQNNVINAGLYVYGIELVDENGTNALPGNVYLGFTLNYTQITRLAPQ